MCRRLFKGDKGLQGNEGKRVSTIEAFSIPPDGNGDSPVPAVTLLEDYKRQLKAGKAPQYQSSTIPEISDETEFWQRTILKP